MKQHGYKAINLDGGLKTYRTAQYHVSAAIKATTERTYNEPTSSQPSTEIELNACGLQCPGPILKVKTAMQDLKNGQKIKVTASDFGFHKDIDAWAKATNNTIINNEIQGDKVVATVQKGVAANNRSVDTSALMSPQLTKEANTIEDGTTIVVFDGNFDKAIASLIIAQGAAAMGQPVTMFFTFWGLNIIKRPDVKLHKKGTDKLFDVVLPHGAQKLPLSTLNMMGMGRGLMKEMMHKHNVDQLEDMLQKAKEAGVKMVACTMSMELMGIQKGELLEGIEYGGVATYLGDARQRNNNLFI